MTAPSTAPALPHATQAPPRGSWLWLIAPGLAAAVLLAAWIVPPLLDWSRLAPRIAAFASARTGLHVALDGPVWLRLLPRPVLVAQNVSLQGQDGAARLGAMRLELSLDALLALRVVPTDLVLDHARITLPGTLPSTVHGAGRAWLRPGFGARMEESRLEIGAVTLDGITADLRVDAATGALQATGTMRAGTHALRFAARRGSPSTDGGAVVSADLSEAATQATAHFDGQITTTATLRGHLRAVAPNSAALGGGPSLRAAVDGRIEARAEGVDITDAALQLGDATGSLSGHVNISGSVSHLNVTLHALNATAWLGTLHVDALRPPLSTSLRAHIDALTVGGLTLRDVQADTVLSPGRVGIARAAATAPGGTSLLVYDAVVSDTDSHGRISFAATDLSALRPAVAPLLPPALADAILPAGQSLRVGGQLAMTKGTITLDNLELRTASAALEGAISATRGAAPTLDATLTAPSLDLAAAGPALRVGLAATRALPPGAAWHLMLKAPVPRLDDAGLRDLSLDIAAGPEGLSVRHAAISAAGGNAEASFALSPAFALADGHAEITLSDSAATLRALPSTWRLAPALFQGPAHLLLSAAGPAGAVAATLRADVSDLRMEAEATADIAAARLTGTATLRHPGAPRLLAMLGVSGTENWLDHGSFALSTHFVASPRAVGISDLSVAAALLHANATGTISLDGAAPHIEGAIAAETLPLPEAPPDDAALPWGLLGFWTGTASLRADHVTFGRRPAADAVHATVSLSEGGLLLDDVEARFAAGRVVGAAAFLADGTEPRLAARGALFDADTNVLPGALLTGGRLDAAADVTARGFSVAALRASLAGDAHAAISNASAVNLDMHRLGRALASHPARPTAALTGSLRAGSTEPLSGALDASVDHGLVTIAPTQLDGAAGTLGLSGVADLADHSVALHVRAQPGGGGVSVPISISGSAAAPARTADFASVLRPARATTTRPPPRHGSKPPAQPPGTGPH